MNKFQQNVFALVALAGVPACDTPADNDAWDRFDGAFCERTVACGMVACEVFWTDVDDECRLDDGPTLDACLAAISVAPCDDTVESTHFAWPAECDAVIHGCEFHPL